MANKQMKKCSAPHTTGEECIKTTHQMQAKIWSRKELTFTTGGHVK
jgi:hypothetical protein